MLNGNFDAVVGMSPVRQNPFWMQIIREDGSLKYLLGEEMESLRRQDLPPVYLINGAIYAIKREIFTTQRSLFPPRTTGYAMPTERSLDIDTQLDMQIAEMLLNAQKI